MYNESIRNQVDALFDVSDRRVHELLSMILDAVHAQTTREAAQEAAGRALGPQAVDSAVVLQTHDTAA